jgi:hypothetical protein
MRITTKRKQLCGEGSDLISSYDYYLPQNKSLYTKVRHQTNNPFQDHVLRKKSVFVVRWFSIKHRYENDMKTITFVLLSSSCSSHSCFLLSYFLSYYSFSFSVYHYSPFLFSFSFLNALTRTFVRSGSERVN